MKKVKLFIFILLIFFFIIIFFYGIFGSSISILSVKEIKSNKKLNKNLINDFKINNLDTIYDKTSNTYYHTVSDNYEDKLYVLKIELEENLKYKLIDETLNVIKVNYKKPIDIIIYNDNYYYETKIQLTNVPLINISTDHDITTNDTNSVFKYINNKNAEKMIINNSKIHIRGASSQIFEKKSYKINMYDKNYNEEKEINISNFYYGNSFILDAVYRDSSKIRNVLATELWNGFSKNFTNTNISSEFVELFINNEYKGLYVLTEPINRRSLNLNKSNDKDTSSIIKASTWENFTQSNKIFNLYSKANLGYEIKYPKDESFYSQIWENFYSCTSKYYDLKIEKNYNIINKCFNINNYIDMIIYNAFINNGDNSLKKNNYFYYKSLDDKSLYIQPWDMEFTFGLNYDSKTEMLSKKDMNSYKKIYTQFFHENASEINKMLIDRYWELRKDVLTEEYFDELLDSYENQLNKGVATRDSKLWYEYDIEKEIKEIRIWLYNRLEFFDSYVRGLENE